MSRWYRWVGSVNIAWNAGSKRELELPSVSLFRVSRLASQVRRPGEAIEPSEQRSRLHPEKASTSRAWEAELEPGEGMGRGRWGRGHPERVARSHEEPAWHGRRLASCAQPFPRSSMIKTEYH